jgi:hypothetical protein
MVKPIVMLDLDNCIADFDKAFLSVSKRLYKKPAKGWVHTHWGFEDCGWSKKETARIWHFIQNTEDFWLTLSPMPGVSSLRKRQRELEYFFVTARTNVAGLPTAYQSEMWLRQRLRLEAPYVIVNAKKGVEAKAIDADYAIDDRIENVLDIARNQPSCKTYILDQPWNQGLTDTRIKRTTSINEFLKDIP